MVKPLSKDEEERMGDRKGSSTNGVSRESRKSSRQEGASKGGGEELQVDSKKVEPLKEEEVELDILDSSLGRMKSGVYDEAY